MKVILVSDIDNKIRNVRQRLFAAQINQVVVGSITANKRTSFLSGKTLTVPRTSFQHSLEQSNKLFGS